MPRWRLGASARPSSRCRRWLRLTASMQRTCISTLWPELLLLLFCCCHCYRYCCCCCHCSMVRVNLTPPWEPNKAHWVYFDTGLVRTQGTGMAWSHPSASLSTSAADHCWEWSAAVVDDSLLVLSSGWPTHGMGCCGARPRSRPGPHHVDLSRIAHMQA